MYFMFSDLFNVFVIGCDFVYLLIVVISGMMDLLNKEELEVVLVYEFGYVCNYDILILMVVVVLVGVVMMVVYWGMYLGFFYSDEEDSFNLLFFLFLVIVVLIVVSLMNFVILCLSEYEVDVMGVKMCGYLLVLVLVLDKMEVLV